MSASTPMAKNDPIFLAWKKYKESEEFKNTYHWGLHEGHLEGLLWAAFLAGCRALHAIAAPSDVNQELTTDDRPYAYLVVQEQGYIVGAWKDRETAEKIASQQLARDKSEFSMLLTPGQTNQLGEFLTKTAGVWEAHQT